MESWYQLMTEFGLGATLSVMVFIAFFFLLKWVLGVSSEQLKSMAEERKAWIKIQEAQVQAQHDVQTQIATNTTTSAAFYQSVLEAHKCQREEHNEMIKCLGRINGYK